MIAEKVSSAEAQILIVDDDQDFRERICSALADRGYCTESAGSVAEARLVLQRRAVEFSPQKAVVDLRMPGESGLVLVAELKKSFPKIKIIVLTGYGSINTAVEAMRLGSVHYLTKPVELGVLLASFDIDEQAEARSNAIALSQNVSVPSLAQVEWEHIQQVYQQCEQNVSKTAQVLGLHRRSLQRKLAKIPTAK